MTLLQLAQLVDGRIAAGDAALRVQDAFTDSRAPRRDGLFIALGGPRFDGHAFVADVLEAGAAAVLVSRRDALGALQSYPGRGALVVRDTREAYLRLAAAHRAAHSRALWFAVTGSAGKTSVKELLAHILSAGAGWKTHRAEKSYNNEIGLPATVLGVTPEHHAVVLELGTNRPGEIERLARVARPNVALITQAGPVHLEALGSVRGVAEEKACLLDFQEPTDAAILNADDAHLEFWRARARGRVLTFGLSSAAEVRAEAIEARPGEGARFFLCSGNGTAEVQLRVPGRHNVLNALAAAAAARAVGVPLQAVVAGLSSFAGTARRFQVTDVRGVAVIDDAYNASPLSFRAALESLRDFAGRRWFVVAGDMLELGAQAEGLHEELGRAIARVSPHQFLTVGPLAGHAGRAALAHGLPAAAWSACATPEAAAECLKLHLRAGDVVLVKGSHAMRLDRCIARLTKAS